MVGLWSLPWYPHSGQAVGQASQEVSAAITTVDPAESPSEVEPRVNTLALTQGRLLSHGLVCE